MRASVAFQVSRLANLMVRALRVVARMDAWDGLVTGGWYSNLNLQSCFHVGQAGHSEVLNYNGC